MSDRCVPLHRCIAAAGDLLSGHFLHRLLRWHRYTKVRHGGDRWVTLTRAQWQVELDCSLKQLRRVLATMEARGFIVREQHGFAGKVSLFVRPTEALLRVAAGGAGGGAGRAQGPTRAGPPGPTRASPAGPTLQTFRIKPMEETKIACGPPAAAAPAPTPAPTPASTPAPARAAAKVAALEALWRDARPSAPITHKMRGQFRHLVRTLRAGEAERAVRYALAHWPRVVRAAEKHHGAFKSPDLPHLGFLVKHIEAVRMMMDKPPHPEEPHGVRRLVGPVLSEAGRCASGAVLRPSVVLSVAKDLIAACNRHEILRCAQDDKRSSAHLRPPIMTYCEMLALDGAAA